MDAIGTRWEELFNRCDELLTEHGRHMPEKDYDMLHALRDKLSIYKDKTWVSVAQINWLSDIEMRCGVG